LIFIGSVVFALSGAGLLLMGWYGLRLSDARSDLQYLSATEFARRHRVVRAGMYACLVSGLVLVLLAIALLCAMLVVVH